MKLRRKNYLTLLEVIIAMALCIVLMSILLFFYRQIDEMNTSLDKMQMQSFEWRYLENRLSEVIPNIKFEEYVKFYQFFSTDDLTGLFKTGSKSLVFMYDRGTDLDKTFSNQVLGRLYLDRDDNLSLATWPNPKDDGQTGMPPIKQEVLFTDVETLNFYFFSVEENLLEQKNFKHEKPDRILEWIDEWKPNYEALPALVKIEIKKKGKDSRSVYYTFAIVATKIGVSYD